MVRYRKIPPASAANQIAEKGRIPPAHEWKKSKMVYVFQTFEVIELFGLPIF